MGKKNEYTNGELTIVWQPELCQHAGLNPMAQGSGPIVHCTPKRCEGVRKQN